MAAAVHVRNRVHSSGAGGVSLTLATGRRVDLSFMRVFGCPAYVHVDKSQRRKLDDRAWKGVFVSYASESPACLVYNPATRLVVSNRNVVSDEAVVLSMGESNTEQHNDDEEDNIPRTMCSEEPDTLSGESPLRESMQHSGSMEDERDMHSGETPRPRNNLRSIASPQQCEPSPKYNLRLTRASGDGWTAGSTAAIKSAISPNVQEPVSYKQALRSPQSEEWEAAIKSEYDSLVSRKTWTFVPCPAGRKLVDSKWVIKLKRDANGQIARYKARLVARGFTQDKGVDYHETFALTMRVISIRTLLALATYNDWEVEQLDMVTAFLEADIEEEIYMRKPEGFCHTDINGEERVCLLKKSLYGLKQAP
jgi:hypothetical protein